MCGQSQHDVAENEIDFTSEKFYAWHKILDLFNHAPIQFPYL